MGRSTDKAGAPPRFHDSQSRLFLLRLLVLVMISPAIIPQPAKALDLAAGLAAVEEGDDRFRPAANLHLGFGEFYTSRLFVYGRDIGPVKERSYLLSVSRRLSFFFLEQLQASLGAAILYDTTKIEYDDPSLPSKDDQRPNLGAAFGVHWEFMIAAKAFGSVAWESHVFPAGILGGIFLATGRKQTLSMSLGYML